VPEPTPIDSISSVLLFRILPLDYLVGRSAEYDPFSSQIAMRSACSVAIVRVAPTVKKIMPI
jgi:hypothetical protein